MNFPTSTRTRRNGEKRKNMKRHNLKGQFGSLWTVACLTGIAFAAPRLQAAPQRAFEPVHDLPNPYLTIENYFKLPDSRPWGASSAIDMDPDGQSIWVTDRCSSNSCAGSNLDPVLKFDASGRLARSFGAGLFNFPHGMHVDREGNVWVADMQGPDGKDPAREGKGHQVIKFSPEGKVLLKLGKAGVAGNGPDTLTEPNDIVTGPNGDIFVAEGHSGHLRTAGPDTPARITKFTRNGKFLKSWGRVGSAPGEFRTPHGLAFDARGRLFVADRGNNCIQIFDQEGRFLEEWKQFGRPSGIFIDGNDLLYCADSESGTDSEPNVKRNPGWQRGIRIGSAKDGKVMYFIPDPETNPGGTSAAEGVTADAGGNVYGAEVLPRGIKKYQKR